MRPWTTSRHRPTPAAMPRLAPMRRRATERADASGPATAPSDRHARPRPIRARPPAQADSSATAVAATARTAGPEALTTLVEPVALRARTARAPTTASLVWTEASADAPRTTNAWKGSVRGTNANERCRFGPRAGGSSTRAGLGVRYPRWPCTQGNGPSHHHAHLRRPVRVLAAHRGRAVDARDSAPIATRGAGRTSRRRGTGRACGTEVPVARAHVLRSYGRTVPQIANALCVMPEVVEVWLAEQPMAARKSLPSTPDG